MELPTLRDFTFINGSLAEAIRSVESVKNVERRVEKVRILDQEKGHFFGSLFFERAHGVNWKVLKPYYEKHGKYAFIEYKKVREIEKIKKAIELEKEAQKIKNTPKKSRKRYTWIVIDLVDGSREEYKTLNTIADRFVLDITTMRKRVAKKWFLDERYAVIRSDDVFIKEDFTEPVAPGRNGFAVIVIDIDTEKKTKYSSITTAIKKLKTTHYRISNCIKDHTVLDGRYLVRYEKK